MSNKMEFEPEDVVVSTLEGEVMLGPGVIRRGAYVPIEGCVVYVVTTEEGTYLLREWELELYSDFNKKKKLNEEVEEWLK